MRSLANKTNVTAPDADYPYGRLKDNDGTGNGTPVNEQVYGDIHQFFEKLMAEAGLAANNLPENVTNGFQLITALKKVIGINTKVIEIGDWDMDTNNSKVVVHGFADYKKIRSVQCTVRRDDDTTYGPLDRALSSGSTPGGVVSWDTNNINLIRTDAVQFDSPDYSAVGFNRGWLIIQYAD